MRGSFQQTDMNIIQVFMCPSLYCWQSALSECPLLHSSFPSLLLELPEAVESIISWNMLWLSTCRCS